MNKNYPWVTILLHIQRRFLWVTNQISRKNKRTQIPIYINRTDKPKSTGDPPKIPTVPVRYKRHKKAALGLRLYKKNIPTKKIIEPKTRFRSKH